MNDWISIIENGLSYKGSGLHILINYFLIGTSLLPYCIGNKRETRGGAWAWVLLIATLVQVLLWFLLGVVGVSVIWSAMMGYMLIDFKRRGFMSEGKNGLLFFSILMALGGIFYYLLTFPMLTTVAHVVALLMGCGLYLIFASKEKTKAPKFH